MKIYSVVATYGGVVNDVLLFLKESEAKKQQRILKKQADPNDDDITLWEQEL